MTVRDMAFGFNERVLAAERTALGMGFYDPKGFHREAKAVALRSTHFVFADHQALAKYIFTTGAAGGFCGYGECLTETGIDEFYLCELIDADLCGAMIGAYVETVRENASQRGKARQHLTSAARIIGGQIEGDYEVHIEPRNVG